MITLRKYQIEFVSGIRSCFSSGSKRVLGVAPTGAGKGRILAHITRCSTEKGRKTLIVAHRSEILKQLADNLKDEGVDHGMIQSGREMRLHAPVQVASIQTLVKRLDLVQKPDMIVLDECFVAGTMIGEVPIEHAYVGMPVTSWNCFREFQDLDVVVRVMKKKPLSLMSVRFSNGSKITCTMEHPIYTKFGWIPAHCLTDRDMVLSITPYDMQSVRRICETQSVWIKGVQIRILQTDDSKHVLETWRGNNAIQENERNARPSCSGACVNEAEGNGVEAACSRGKRETASSGSSAAGVRSWVGNGIGCIDRDAKRVRIPTLLQGGHSESGVEGWSGSGWSFSRISNESCEGQKEVRLSEWVRVDHIEIHKQTSDGTFGGMCPDGFVYNLETAKHHNYVANGILAHNCHHVASSSYHSMLSAYSGAKILGVTATPERLDGKGLGDYFQTMVRGPEVQWLIDNGFLAKPTYYAPSTVDLSSVSVRMGDYAKNEIAGIMDKPAIIGDAVQSYMRFAAGKTAIAFCVNLKHARDTAEAFNAVNIKAEVIDGTMDDGVRTGIVRRVRDGHTKLLVSCELVGEGFDAPAVGAAILLRPTASLGLHLQQVGRTLRPKADGSGAIILDHVGNCVRHGLAEEQREWSLEGASAKRRKPEVAIETRRCEKCYAVYTGVTCPQCGEIRQSKQREIEIREGELQKLEVEKLIAHRQQIIENAQCRTFQDFQKVAQKRGYKRGWAYHRWKMSKWNNKTEKVI